MEMSACYDKVNLSHVRCTNRLQTRTEACLSRYCAAPGTDLHSYYFTASCCSGLLGDVDIWAHAVQCRLAEQACFMLMLMCCQAHLCMMTKAACCTKG